MPSGDFSRPTGGRKKLKRTKSKPSPTPAPRTDVQSSGSDYGTRKAKAFKKTPEYKPTVRAVKKREQAKRALKPGRITPDEAQTAGLGAALDTAASKIGGVVDDVAPTLGKIVYPATIPLGKVIPDGDKIIGNAFKDALNLPVQTIPSVYHVGERVVEGKLGEAGEMILQPYKDLAKNPRKAFKDHPLGSALLVAGPVRGTTRSAGAVMRKTPGLKKAASTTRSPRTLPGSSLTQTRSYSRDPVVKAGQVVRERAKLRKARKLRKQADKVEVESVARANELRRKADRADPTRIRPREVRRRVDERVAVTEDVRRANRTDVTNATRELIGLGSRNRLSRARPDASMRLIAENITRADKADLKAYVRELEAEFPKLDSAGQRANRQLRQQIEKVIADKRWDAGQVEVAARKYSEFNRSLQDDLVRLKVLAPEQADSRLVPYAVREMDAATITEWPEGSRFPKQKLVVPGPNFAKFRAAERRLVQAREDYAVAKAEPDGNVVRAALDLDNARTDLKASRENAYTPLSSGEIRAHMRENKRSEPAWVSQAPNNRGARNFYVASDRAPSVGRLRRTGEATRRGTFDADPETLVEANARAAGLRDAADGFRRWVGEFAHTNERGKVRTFNNRTRAQQAADNLATETGVRFRPVRINPWAGRREQLQQFLDDIDAESADGDKTVLGAIEKAIDGDDGPGPWALVIDEAADQLGQHMRVLGAGAPGKTWQVINQAFRQTVLALSPKWLTGNTVEAGLRAGVARAGPRSYVTGRKALKRADELDPAKAQEARARTVGGGHFSMAEKQRIHRDASQFEGTRMEPLARGLGAFWRAPGPKQLADLWHGYTQFVFRTLNGNLESHFQTAMLGKALRDSPLMDGRLVKLSDKAIDDAARGLLKTENQVEFGRAVDRMYGKYGKFGPAERKAIALYTPFIAWSLNAVKFVYGVLPRDHPVLTSLIVAAERASEEWRKEHGLDLFMEEGVPAFLQGSIPGKDGSHLRLSRYTPFGAFADPGATAADAVLPQFSGPLAALSQGEDFKGAKLRKDGKEVDFFGRALYAAQFFAEATIPAVGISKRIATGEGPLGERVRSQVDPFKFTQGSKTLKRSGPTGREAELLRRQAEQFSGGGISEERQLELLRRQAELLGGG